MDELYLEECRARFEYEELMALKSELERRKLDERKEMEQLREELASMHTLYQYRTCSVDSSESSDEEAATAAEGSEGKAKEGSRDKEEEVEELSKVLSNLVRENKELEVRQQNNMHGISSSKFNGEYFFRQQNCNCAPRFKRNGPPA